MEGLLLNIVIVQNPSWSIITIEPIFGNKWVWNNKKSLKKVCVDFDKLTTSSNQAQMQINEEFTADGQIWNQDAISNFCEEKLLLQNLTQDAISNFCEEKLLLPSKNKQTHNHKQNLTKREGITSLQFGNIQLQSEQFREIPSASRNILKPKIKSSFFWSSIQEKKLE